MSIIDDFPVTVNIPVAWGDMDAFNHVNNIIYFKYFETARIKYFEKIGFLEMLENFSIGPILANTSCSFKKPIQYPDLLIVGARVKSMKSSSFVMEYIIISDKLGTSAMGEGVIVSYNYKESAKVNIPEEIVLKIESLENKKI